MCGFLWHKNPQDIFTNLIYKLESWRQELISLVYARFTNLIKPHENLCNPTIQENDKNSCAG